MQTLSRRCRADSGRVCPELDIAGQGATVEEAKPTLKEAVELFLESADPDAVRRRTRGELFVSRFEVSNG